jgi:histone H3
MARIKQVVTASQARPPSDVVRKVLAGKSINAHNTKLGQKVAGDSVKKPHRFRPGTVALREIKAEQKTHNLKIPKAVMQRLVREITRDYAKDGGDVRVTREAFFAIQEAAEAYLTNVMERTQRLAIHAKRITIMPVDMQLAVDLAGDAVNKQD